MSDTDKLNEIRDVLTNLEHDLNPDGGNRPYYDDRFELYVQAIDDIDTIAFRELP